MILVEGSLRFNFINARSAIKFDEQDKSAQNFHGLSHCMKAVDFVVEYDDRYLFVEVKDPKRGANYGTDYEDGIVNALVMKFRDTFIYRWSEEKLDKPVHYQCLVDIENALLLNLMTELRRKLPAIATPNRWLRQIADLCVVANVETWNAIFSDMPVVRI